MCCLNILSTYCILCSSLDTPVLPTLQRYADQRLGIKVSLTGGLSECRAFDELLTCSGSPTHFVQSLAGILMVNELLAQRLLRDDEVYQASKDMQPGA